MQGVKWGWGILGGLRRTPILCYKLASHFFLTCPPQKGQIEDFLKGSGVKSSKKEGQSELEYSRRGGPWIFLDLPLGEKFTVAAEASMHMLVVTQKSIMAGFSTSMLQWASLLPTFPATQTAWGSEVQYS